MFDILVGEYKHLTDFRQHHYPPLRNRAYACSRARKLSVFLSSRPHLPINLPTLFSTLFLYSTNRYNLFKLKFFRTACNRRFGMNFTRLWRRWNCFDIFIARFTKAENRFRFCQKCDSFETVVKLDSALDSSQQTEYQLIIHRIYFLRNLHYCLKLDSLATPISPFQNHSKMEEMKIVQSSIPTIPNTRYIHVATITVTFTRSHTHSQCAFFQLYNELYTKMTHRCNFFHRLSV